MLRAVDYRDSDVILTLLTDTRGKISANARGARSRTSALRAGSQLLTCSDYTFYERNGKLYVKNADTAEQFVGLRRSIESLSLAAYFCEVLDATVSEEVPSEALLTDALNLLYALSKDTTDAQLIKAVFELRIAAMAGWTPDVGDCAICGEPPKQPVLDIDGGVVVCAAHTRQSNERGSRAALCDASLGALRHILTAPSKKMLSFQLTGEAASRLRLAAELFLLNHIGRGFATLDFYKSLM